MTTQWNVGVEKAYSDAKSVSQNLILYSLDYSQGSRKATENWKPH